MKKIILFSFLILISCKKETNKEIIIFKDSPEKTTIKKNHLINGKKIFNGSCATCHLYGTGGSITISDKKSWEKIYKTKDIKTIYNNVLNGFNTKTGIMPKKGGCISCTDQDVIDAVNFMFSVNNINITN